jgi:hypothetical protein
MDTEKLLTEQKGNDTNCVFVVNCQWCFKPITVGEPTVVHEIMGLVHEKCVDDFDNDCMNALCGVYSNDPSSE